MRAKASGSTPSAPATSRRPCFTRRGRRAAWIRNRRDVKPMLPARPAESPRLRKWRPSWRFWRLMPPPRLPGPPFPSTVAIPLIRLWPSCPRRRTCRRHAGYVLSERATEMPAVDHDVAAGHETAGVRGQQQQCAGQLLDLPDALHRYHAVQPLLVAGLHGVLVDLGLEEAGRDGIDPDAVARPLQRQTLRHVLHTGLGRVVGHQHLRHAAAEDGGDIDDAAGFLRLDEPLR